MNSSGLNPVLGPRTSPIDEEGSDGFPAVAYTVSSGDIGCRSPFDVRMEHFEAGLIVATLPRLIERLQTLHVLLRHRPRSIPQAQESA